MRTFEEGRVASAWGLPAVDVLERKKGVREGAHVSNSADLRREWWYLRKTVSTARGVDSSGREKEERELHV